MAVSTWTDPDHVRSYLRAADDIPHRTHGEAVEIFSALTDIPAPFTGGSLFGGFLIVFLMGVFYAAVGCLASALTSSQIIAGVVTTGLLFIHYFLGYVTVIYGDRFPAAPLFRYISSNEHLRYFSKGLIDSRTLVYYLTAAAFVLFLTHHVINHRRWRS